MEINIPEIKLQEAAGQGTDAFLKVVHDAMVMDGGFIQLIHNGYGPFIFLNPFAKAMRLWGAHEFSKLVYKGRKLFEQHSEALTKDCTDEQFMALFEQYPEFDDLDDEFIEMEEEVTDTIAHYVDDHLEQFVHVIKAD